MIKDNEKFALHYHTGGKWLIHGTKHSEATSCKAWNSPVVNPSRESKHDTTESEGNMFNPRSKRISRGRNIQGGAYLQNQNDLASESLNM